MIFYGGVLPGELHDMAFCAGCGDWFPENELVLSALGAGAVCLNCDEETRAGFDDFLADWKLDVPVEFVPYGWEAVEGGEETADEHHRHVA